MSKIRNAIVHNNGIMNWKAVKFAVENDILEFEEFDDYEIEHGVAIGIDNIILSSSMEVYMQIVGEFIESLKVVFENNDEK